MARMPTREEFYAVRDQFACPFCGEIGTCDVDGDAENNRTHGQGRFKCANCWRGNWFSLPKNRKKRQSVSQGEVDAVWIMWGNRCGFCDAHGDALDEKRIGRERQHIPAFSTDPNAKTVPICSSCNAISAALIRRTRRDEAEKARLIENAVADVASWED